MEPSYEMHAEKRHQGYWAGGGSRGFGRPTYPFKPSIFVESHFVAAYLDEKIIAFHFNRRIICYHLFGTLVGINGLHDMEKQSLGRLLVWDNCNLAVR